MTLIAVGASNILGVFSALMGRTNLLIALATTAILCLCPGPAYAQEIRFRWAIGTVAGTSAARHYAALGSDDVTVTGGDELKIFLSPMSRCFIYVLHQDQAGEFEVLFPVFGKVSQPLPVASAHYIPPESDWLVFDNAKGIERIYLIASTMELTALQERLQSRAGGQERTRAIVAELARLQKEFVARGWSERPVTIGGQVRGRGNALHPDVALDAKEISVLARFYSRVFIIDHR
jgi:hypothetical protein